MTQSDRAKSILKKILALPEEAWALERLGDVDTNVTLQSGWTALVTPKFIDWPPNEEELLAAGEAEIENDFPYSFTVDLLVAGKGKVMSFDCGYEERLTAMRPGPWERELFGIELAHRASAELDGLKSALTARDALHSEGAAR